MGCLNVGSGCEDRTTQEEARKASPGWPLALGLTVGQVWRSAGLSRFPACTARLFHKIFGKLNAIRHPSS